MLMSHAPAASMSHGIDASERDFGSQQGHEQQMNDTSGFVGLPQAPLPDDLSDGISRDSKITNLMSRHN